MIGELPGRIAVVTGDPSLPDPTKYGQRYGPEDLKVHAVLREALASLGSMEFQVLERHADLIEQLDALRPELVLNFCDTGLFNRPEQEIHLGTQLELMGLGYSGAPARAILLCFDKQVVSLLANSLGVAVANEYFLPAEAVATAEIDTFPALIKPNRADGSVGITKDAVVRDAGQARAYLRWLRAELPGTDLLVQEYLPGPEYGLGLIGNPETGLEALPMLEVDYAGLPTGLAPILSFESKTQPDSPYWQDIRLKPAELSMVVQQDLAARCRKLFARLGLRDYGRFDFRTAADGSIRLMEVNPNPAWGYDAKLAIMAGFGGWSYAEMLERLVATAWERIRRNAGGG
ncbi:MAG: D-alanine--D-alanine ligase [Gammaproteobacteria bacterium]|nr:D-alanine--D-alanine ligase [Gammaproteobacteria bacterium]